MEETEGRDGGPWNYIMLIWRRGGSRWARAQLYISPLQGPFGLHVPEPMRLWWREEGMETSRPTGVWADHWVAMAPFVDREETPGRQSGGPARLVRRGLRPAAASTSALGIRGARGALPRQPSSWPGPRPGKAEFPLAWLLLRRGRRGRGGPGPLAAARAVDLRAGSGRVRERGERGQLGSEGSAPTGSPGARARARAPPIGAGWGRRQPELPAPPDTPTQCLGGASRNRQRLASARTARREAPRVRAASRSLARALGRAG